jgi:hypothetical protein
MSYVGNPTLSTRSQLRAHWILVISTLAALLAATAVALVLVIDNGTSTVSGSIAKPQAALRSDGGPDESAVAASVGSRPSSVPDESAVAAAVGSVTAPSPVPDEAAAAAAIRRNGGPSQYLSVGPDESTIAASISGR